MIADDPAARHADPSRIVTRRDFAREINLLRETSNLTIRELARDLGVPHTTIGGYFSGAHLPAPALSAQLQALLRALGIGSPRDIDLWLQALRRARRGSGDQAAPTSAVDVPTYLAPFTTPHEPESIPDRAYLISTRPPVERLDREPRLRGRDELLTTLDAAVARVAHPGGREHSTVGGYVLHGLGGGGKSMLAIAVARRAIDRGVRTWWISAIDRTTLAAGMQALAIELGAGQDQIRLGSSADLVWRLLLGQTQPWLLIMDNADDIDNVLALPGAAATDGTGWIRPVPATGMLLVTTQDGSAGTWGAPPVPWLALLPVPILDPAAGSEVLRELAADAGSVREAKELADRLGGLPLALCQAGRYLADTRAVPDGFAEPGAVRTFADYSAALDRGQLPVLSGSGRASRDTVGRTWELSLDLLSGRGVGLARPLLRLMSCFAAAPLPYDLLLPPTVLAASPLFAGSTPRAVWQALRALADLAVVDLPLTPLGSPLTLHPLVRGIYRPSVGRSGELASYLDLVTEVLVHATADLDPKDPACWAGWRALADHAQSPLDLAEQAGLRPSAIPAPAIRVAMRLAQYFKGIGQLSRAETTYARTLRLGRAALAAHDADVLEVQHQLCRVWYDLGRFEAAVRGFRSVLHARTTTLGPTHPDTLTTQHYLARALRDAGDVDPAWRLFRKTYDARRTMLGDTHTDTLTSRNNVGDALRALGSFDQAEQELRAVHDGRIAVLGSEHPATLVTRFHLARLAHDRGHLEQAADELKSLVADSRRILGDLHPRTLTAEQGLADVRHDQHALDEAYALARDVWRRRHDTLGEHHPATLVMRHRIALIMVDQDHVEEARTHLEQVLAARRTVLGLRHPDTVLTRDALVALRRR
ncbi:FxSxx-COOH system tetratricopeptide repeat protein [Catellatospora sp. NPDC049111]|uniref:FxSxx-COOH system tetratricopeptide repeat protein n=1 Tax=Catellatospora sp. NPDC049111 TaxID=3155271 RepID=UPI0033F78A57